MLLSLLSGLIIGAASVVFILQNVFPVTVTFFSWSLTTSVALVVALALFTGFLVSSLISIPSVVRDMFIISNLKKENKRLTDELQASQMISQEKVQIENDSSSVL